ncbi:enoyl-CoA hydratase, partial [Histophilus somni]
EEQVKAYFKKTKGANYDWQGVFGLVLGFSEKKSKFFCSEWCFNAIFRSEKGWRFNPNQLAQIVADFKRI